MSAKLPRLLPSPTITGPKQVTVGGSTYGVPESAGVVVTAGGNLAYVLFRARLHLLGPEGEIEIPPTVRASLASKYFGGRR